MAFLSGVIIRQHGRCRGPLRKRYQRHVCAVAAGVTEESIESRLVEDTPITKELNVSPMKKVDREYYIAQATDSVAAAVQDVRNGQKGGSLMNVTMLIPDLNPALDVYDRRFLVKVVWEIVTEMVVHRGMTVKVMTQSATKFGGLPISVAGLMRSFESDKARSAEGWGGAMERVRTSDIDAAAVEEDDDLFLIMSATNSTSSPVIEDCMALAKVAGSRPILIINGRLGDVPSHSGVMQVQGRRERQEFLDSFWDPVYIRLLYTPGQNYPIRGILRRIYPGPWQVWNKVETEKGQPEIYNLLAECEKRPTSDELNAAFVAQSVNGEVGLPLPFSLGLLAAGAAVAGWIFLSPFVF